MRRPEASPRMIHASVGWNARAVTARSWAKLQWGGGGVIPEGMHKSEDDATNIITQCVCKREREGEGKTLPFPHLSTARVLTSVRYTLCPEEKATISPPSLQHRWEAFPPDTECSTRLFNLLNLKRTITVFLRGATCLLLLSPPSTGEAAIPEEEDALFCRFPEEGATSEPHKRVGNPDMLQRIESMGQGQSDRGSTYIGGSTGRAEEGIRAISPYQ